MPLFLLRLGLAMTLVTMFAASSAAQNMTAGDRLDVTAGYQWLQGDEQFFQVGANGDIARMRGAVGFVADVGWAYDKEKTLPRVIYFHWHTWNLGLGPRWAFARGERFRPYAQLIGGALYTRFTATFPEPDPSRPPSAFDGVVLTSADTAFMLQPGLGINVAVADGWGVVGRLDYRRAFINDDDDPEPTFPGPTNGENQLRLVVGVSRTF